MAIVGIDLGTSNSAAAVLRGGRPIIIPSAEGVSIGGKAFPSYVAFTADGQTLVGELARRQATVNPEGTATAFKRQMGQRVKIKLRDKEFSPEQLSAFLLQKNQTRCGSFSRRASAEGRGDGAGLFRRQSTQRDEGRLRNRRPRSRPARQ